MAGSSRDPSFGQAGPHHAARPVARLFAPGSLAARLRAGAVEPWSNYTGHAFVRGLADGSLPEPAFRRYLIQDYLFLVHFSRAYGLAVFKGVDLQEMRQASATLSALLDVEMRLHVDYCGGWGLREADMAATDEAAATVAYTRFVIDRGVAGDLLDLLTALAPCVLGYGEIGETLLRDPATRLDGNPYRAWIEMYGGEEYLSVAEAASVQLDRVARKIIGDAIPTPRLNGLQSTFTAATRLEAAFWQMGLTEPD